MDRVRVWVMDRVVMDRVRVWHTSAQNQTTNLQAEPPLQAASAITYSVERSLNWSLSLLFLSLSLSLIFITRVAPHCVNTSIYLSLSLMILHAAHTHLMSAG
jgi:hypothetical protein